MSTISFRERPTFLHDILCSPGEHISVSMSMVAGAKLKGNWFWWDFGDKVYSRKGSVTYDCNNTPAVRCTKVPANHLVGTWMHQSLI